MDRTDHPGIRAEAAAVGALLRRHLRRLCPGPALVAQLAARFRAQHGLRAVPGLEAHDALHLLLGQPPTREGELRVLFVQGVAAATASALPVGHPVRRLLRRLVTLEAQPDEEEEDTPAPAPSPPPEVPPRAPGDDPRPTPTLPQDPNPQPPSSAAGARA